MSAETLLTYSLLCCGDEMRDLAIQFRLTLTPVVSDKAPQRAAVFRWQLGENQTHLLVREFYGIVIAYSADQSHTNKLMLV